MDLGRREALHPLLDQEPAHHAVELGPHHRHVGDGAVRDPHLRAGKNVVIPVLHRLRLHPARVRTVVGLRQAEAADRLAGPQRREPPLLLRLAPERVDRVHHQRTLHGGEAAQPRVAALQLLHDEAVRNLVDGGQPISLQVGAEEPHLPQHRDDMLRESARPVMIPHDREEFPVHEIADRIPDHARLRRKPAFQVVIIDSLEHRAHSLCSGYSRIGAVTFSSARRSAFGPPPPDRAPCARRCR